MYYGSFGGSNPHNGGDIWLAIFFLFSLLAIGIGVCLFRFPMSGQHNVYVTAIDRGLLCTAVYVKTDTESSQEDIYSISNDSLYIEELEEIVKSKNRILLKYSSVRFGICSRLIDDVEVLEDSN